MAQWSRPVYNWTEQVNTNGVPATDVFNIKGSCTFSTNNTLDKITLCIENEKKKMLDKFLLLTDKANTTLKTLMKLLSEMASYLIRENEIDAKPTIYPVRLDCLLLILKPYKGRLEYISRFLPNNVLNTIWNNEIVNLFLLQTQIEYTLL